MIWVVPDTVMGRIGSPASIARWNPPPLKGPHHPLGLHVPSGKMMTFVPVRIRSAARFMLRIALSWSPVAIVFCFSPARSVTYALGNRFMSMMVVNKDAMFYEVDYTPGNYNFTRAEVGTRYVFMALRFLSTLPIRKT